MAGVVEINQVGKREDLRDFISIVDMKDKPFMASIQSFPDQKNMLVSWQADAYATPQSTGIADGEDVSTYENAAANRALIQNYGQKFRRTAMVGDLAENVSNVAGAAAGELARSIDKKLEEISRDMEFAFCSDQDAQLEVGIGAPYKTKGMGVWASTAGGSVLTVPAAFRTPAAQILTGGATLTEANLRTALASVYKQHGKRYDLNLICGPTIKGKISDFTAAHGTSTNAALITKQYTKSLDERTVITNITLYEGDFQTVKVSSSLLLAGSAAGAVPSDADLSNRAYAFPREVIGFTYNRPPNVRKLPDMGGGPRALVESICCLVVKNPLVLLKIST